MVMIMVTTLNTYYCTFRKNEVLDLYGDYHYSSASMLIVETTQLSKIEFLTFNFSLSNVYVGEKALGRL